MRRARAVAACLAAALQLGLAPGGAHAKAALTGRVVDTAGQSVPGARVHLGAVEARCDAEGIFVLDVEPPGPGDALSVDAPGYTPLTLPAPAAAGVSNLSALRLVLSPSTPRDGGLTVTGRRAASGQTRHSLDGETLRRVAGTGGDPLRALTLLPGFSRSPYGSGRLIVRGARENTSAVFVDGMRVPNVFHFGFGPSVFAPDMIERIDFYPGSFPVRYGQLTGGVVDVSLRPGEADHWQGATDVDLADAGAFAQGPLGDTTTLAVSMRRSYVDAFLNAGASWFGIRDATNVVPVYWDYQARLDHTPAPGARLTLMLVGARDELSFLDDPASEDAERITAMSRWDRLRATWEQRVGAGTLTVSPTLGLDTQRAVGGDDAEEEVTADEDEERRLEGHLRAELRLPVDTTWRLLLGFEAATRDPGANVQPAPRVLSHGNDGGLSATAPEATPAGRLLAAPYAEATARYPFGLTVVPGVRADLVSVAGTEALTVDPRVTVRQALRPGTDDLNVKLALGRFSQVPYTVRRQPGETTLRVAASQAWHYGAGLEWQADAATTVVSDLWLSRGLGSGRFRYTLAVDADGLARAEPSVRRGQRRAYGWEFLLKRQATRQVSGWISYSLARAEVRQPGEAWQRSDFDATHRLTSVWNVRLPAGWGVGVSATLASGYPQPVTGGVFDPRAAGYLPMEDEGAPPARMPMYHQVDLRLEKCWAGEVVDTTGYVDLINAGGSTNTEGWEWDYRYAHPRPLRGMPVFPALGVQVVFK